MSRKIISVLLAMVMLFSLTAISGCSKESTKTTGKGGKVKITYSMWGSADEGAATQKVADAFNASQDRIEVEIMFIPWENYMTKLNTMATAKTLPDTGL
jgi:multiple sugar transport system substrate-binding protein